MSTSRHTTVDGWTWRRWDGGMRALAIAWNDQAHPDACSDIASEQAASPTDSPALNVNSMGLKFLLDHRRSST
jgi:hypothetical protein